jgi:hypothetical protein
VKSVGITERQIDGDPSAYCWVNVWAVFCIHEAMVTLQNEVCNFQSPIVSRRRSPQRIEGVEISNQHNRRRELRDQGHKVIVVPCTGRRQINRTNGNWPRSRDSRDTACIRLESSTECNHAVRNAVQRSNAYCLYATARSTG